MTAPHPSSVILPSAHLLGPAGEHPPSLLAHIDKTRTPSNMMDEANEHTSLTLSTEHDSIYTYTITSERSLAGGSQRCPYPDQPCEQIQTDVGHTRLHFYSYSVTLILASAILIASGCIGIKELVPLSGKNMY